MSTPTPSQENDARLVKSRVFDLTRQLKEAKRDKRQTVSVLNENIKRIEAEIEECLTLLPDDNQ